MITLHTERLTLRPFTLADAGFILALVNDPDWLRFIGDKAVHSEHDARRYLRDGPLAMYESQGFGLYAIDRNEDGATVGMCGLIRRPGLDDVDLGFALLAAMRGHGYGQEAARAMLKHGLHALGIARVVAITDLQNVSSARLLTQIGMCFERDIQLPGDAQRVALYAVQR